MKMEIELTDEQAKKVEILNEHDIDVGDAIDILFEMKDAVIDSSNKIVDARLKEAEEQRARLEDEMRKVDDKISFFSQLKDTSLDASQKQKMFEKEYNVESTYDEAVQKSKHEFKWTKAIFDF
jgi:hypothetical protein